MNRRRFLGTLGAGGVTLGLGGAASSVGARRLSQGDAPNVLFLAIDDQNDWVGCYGGHPDAQTPNIDAFAQEGVLFEQSHCAAPLCNPSRAALLSGIRPFTSGIYLNSQDWRLSPRLSNAITLPHHFMRHGYSVMGSGKIFHGGFNDPLAWHEYYYKPGDPSPPVLPANGIAGLGNLDWGPVDVTDDAMGDTQVANWTIAKLQQTHTKPFFLACGFFKPHLPWYVPRPYFDKFPPASVTLPTIKLDDLDDVPPIPRGWANTDENQKIMDAGKWADGVAAYLACNNYTDTQMGRVLEAFYDSPYADNTIVILWCDHGWHLAEKLHWKKFTLWEEATRAPLIVKAPGVTQPAQRCPRTVDFMDIYPTLIELCGLTPKAEMEGESLVPLLRNPQALRSRPAVTTYQRGNHSIRTERWRYTRYIDGTEELYDHDADPLEWTNQAGNSEHSSVKQELSVWLPRYNAPNMGEPWPKISRLSIY